MLALLPLLLAGCGSEWEPGSWDGGAIVVRASPAGLSFGAEIYGQASASLPAIPRPDGTCRVTPHDKAGSLTISVSDIDLGPTVTVSDQARSVSATQRGETLGPMLSAIEAVPAAETLHVSPQGPSFSYVGGLPGASAFGSTWRVMSSGTSNGVTATELASASIPGRLFQPITFTSPGSVIAGQPATLTWAGGAGAHFFHIYATGNDARADCYLGPTAKSFVLPAEVTARLGSGALAHVYAEATQVVDFGWRRVLVLARADAAD